MKTTLSRSYGSHFCPFCLLTVAEFVNGRLYPEFSLHVHDFCVESLQAVQSKGGFDHANR